MWDEGNCVVVWAFFGIAFLWAWIENWPFPVLWPLLSFPNLPAYWVQPFTASSHYFPLSLCYDHWGRLSYLSMLFFGNLRSNRYIFPFLLFCSQLFLWPPQRTILPCCISFSWGWSCSLPPVQCQKPPSIALQALCLSYLIPWICLSLPLYNRKGFDFGHTLNGLVVFPTFFNLSLNLAIRSSWSEPESAPSLVFADCTELLHLWLQRI